MKRLIKRFIKKVPARWISGYEFWVVYLTPFSFWADIAFTYKDVKKIYPPQGADWQPNYKWKSYWGKNKPLNDMDIYKLYKIL
jgi:hypothetical protein